MTPSKIERIDPNASGIIGDKLRLVAPDPARRSSFVVGFPGLSKARITGHVQLRSQPGSTAVFKVNTITVTLECVQTVQYMQGRVSHSKQHVIPIISYDVWNAGFSAHDFQRVTDLDIPFTFKLDSDLPASITLATKAQTFYRLRATMTQPGVLSGKRTTSVHVDLAVSKYADPHALHLTIPLFVALPPQHNRGISQWHCVVPHRYFGAGDALDIRVCIGFEYMHVTMTSLAASVRQYVMIASDTTRDISSSLIGSAFVENANGRFGTSYVDTGSALVLQLSDTQTLPTSTQGIIKVWHVLSVVVELADGRKVRASEPIVVYSASGFIAANIVKSMAASAGVRPDSFLDTVLVTNNYHRLIEDTRELVKSSSK